MRTHEDKKVADLAKETVRKWKNDVAGQKKPEEKALTATTSPASPTLQTKTSVDKSPDVANGDVNHEKRENGPPHGDVKKVRDEKSDSISKVHTGEKTRDSSIILLYKAIVMDSTESTSA